jgi:hypothetical protein
MITKATAEDVSALNKLTPGIVARYSKGMDHKLTY